MSDLTLSVITAGKHPNGQTITEKALQIAVDEWNVRKQQSKQPCYGQYITGTVVLTTTLNVMDISHTIDSMVWNPVNKTVEAGITWLSNMTHGGNLKLCPQDKLMRIPVCLYAYSMTGVPIDRIEIHRIDISISPVPYVYPWPGVPAIVTTGSGSGLISDYDRAMRIVE